MILFFILVTSHNHSLLVLLYVVHKTHALWFAQDSTIHVFIYLQCTLERFVDWWQCAAVMQKEAVTVMPSCSGGRNVAVA
jgi:hypothetical protein